MYIHSHHNLQLTSERASKPTSERASRRDNMKNYKVIGGFTVYEQYQINVQAKDSKDAIKKAEKIGISHWDELQNSNDDSGFVIDDVWEEE